MEQEAILALKEVNLRKISKACNFPSCRKLPSKQAMILEVSNSGKKELVDLYFCEEHYDRNIQKILEKLTSACEKGALIEKRVFDIGYVTY